MLETGDTGREQEIKMSHFNNLYPALEVSIFPADQEPCDLKASVLLLVPRAAAASTRAVVWKGELFPAQFQTWVCRGPTVATTRGWP